MREMPSPTLQKYTALRFTLANYVSDIWRSSPSQCWFTLTLLFISSLFEGVGYLLLLPIIGFLGLSEDAEKTDTNSILDPILNILSSQFSLGLILIIFLGILACRSVLTYLSLSCGVALKVEFLNHHRQRLHRSLIMASWSFLLDHRRSSLTHALTTQSDIIVNGVNLVIRGLALLFTMLIAILFAILLSWQITLGVLVIGAISLLPLYMFNRKAYKLGDLTRQKTSELFEHSVRYFKGLKALKATSAEKYILSYFDEKSTKHSQISGELERNFAKATLVYQLLSAIFLVVIVYVSLSFFPSQKTEIVVLIIIFSRLAPRINTLQSYVNSLAAIMPEYEAAEELRHLAELEAESITTTSSSLKVVDRLSLSQIHFHFNKKEEEVVKTILQDITLDFPVNSATAIVGHSGAGKTTLVDIITGLLTPTQGAIKIDGKSLNPDEHRNFKQHIEYITDNSFLFDETISKNLSFGQENVSEAEIWKALEMANAKDFVSFLPRGLETKIGDGGLRLSRGQRQRLSLTRGLLRNPFLLVLDEPTSALSIVDTQIIIDSLKKLSRDKILIIITHDETAFNWVDQVVRIENGRIVG